MKPFLFVTDFDGTMTAQDFFEQILYRYEHNKIFSKNNKQGFELLKEVLEGANLNQKQFDEEIRRIPLDPNFKSFVNFIKQIGGDVLILSAGAKYYIEKKLSFEEILDVEIIANIGKFESDKFEFLKIDNKAFYSKNFGVDKKSVMQFYRDRYEKIAYAGDSYVDFEACKLADFIFAKRNLIKILDMFNIKYYYFKNFDDIRREIIDLLNC